MRSLIIFCFSLQIMENNFTVGVLTGKMPFLVFPPPLRFSWIDATDEDKQNRKYNDKVGLGSLHSIFPWIDPTDKGK